MVKKPPMRSLVRTLKWSTHDDRVTVFIQVCTVTNKILDWTAEDWHGNDASRFVDESDMRDYVDQEVGEEVT